jgi:phosphoglycolate phosphatase-like HAD superfamily hydrolase
LKRDTAGRKEIMRDTLSDFIKSKGLLVCVDSDGCAMDTMEVKHRKCFGPKAVEVWGLQEVETKFLEVWNNVNLYSKTRGINRFKGLVKTFELMAADGVEMPKFSSILEWTRTAKELSNPALEREIEKTGNEELIKTLVWSNAVNKAIKELHGEDKPFENVKEGLESITDYADIVIVSSANSGAVKDEWNRHGLAPFVNTMLGQEAGTKAFCIAGLKVNGYHEDEVLMVGDAPGDLEAATQNGVLFYPILVGREGFSWKRLAEEAIKKLADGSYRGEYEQKLIEEFNSTLK